MTKTKRYNQLIIVAMIGLLSACAAPIRSDPSAFKLVANDEIQPSNVQPFADCVIDGFSEVWVMSTYTFRQQRRTQGVRVEQLANSFIGMSADVNNDGSVKLYESSAMILVNTKPAISAFSGCVDRFK